MTLPTPRSSRTAAIALVLGALAPAVAVAQQSTTPPPATTAAQAAVDSSQDDISLPVGFGSLRQDDIAIKLQLPGVQVKAIPLTESVIRTLSPDSYKTLHDLKDSQRAAIARIAQRYGLRQPKVWYVSFFGLQPDAPFSPLDIDVSNVGRDFRPVDLIPLTSGFGENRIQQRAVQSAIYVFDDALDVEQPLTVAMGGQTNMDWSSILQLITRERSLIRSRAARTQPVQARRDSTKAP